MHHSGYCRIFTMKKKKKKMIANRSFQNDKVAFFLHVICLTKKTRNEKKWSHLLMKKKLPFLTNNVFEVVA